ncbi:hypothetical protein M430DRAFT_34715 [Amorphotheca resinae ATCC 22711]|uniref:Uncharacterized protein n=1 Tax=Amorphotheca resinae ATCC 22711 TaxID=857342 RepID=A0A2T3B468_AMORE|nr:hypothetical protein M430DRAFT_34715 [Amorphotheca resinae ATCC 22711]PSS20437.1 hypothetical protein M430DRAFT_34715 [Amorphotheca resinae ATCC 22711]
MLFFAAARGPRPLNWSLAKSTHAHLFTRLVLPAGPITSSLRTLSACAGSPETVARW